MVLLSFFHFKKGALLSFLFYKLLLVITFLLIPIQESLAHDILDPREEIPHKSVEPDKFQPEGEIVEEESFRNYQVRVYHGQGEGSFEILKKGKRVYARLGEYFEISCSSKKGKIPVGKNITGNGVPNLIISEHTGGNACCSYRHVFEIGEKFHLIGEISLLQADAACFEEVDSNPNLIIWAADDIFRCWVASCAASPAPGVIYQYKNGSYQLALDLMKKMGPDIQKLDGKAAFYREKGNLINEDEFAELWGIMLDLIYSGHADIAWDFFNKAWPKGKSGKKEDLQSFKNQLAKSELWPQIKAMNNIK